MLLLIFMKLVSSAFEHNSDIPAKYTCDGENVNPEIAVFNVPDRTVSFALIMDDPDSPSGNFLHWIIWNIPFNGSSAGGSDKIVLIKENEVPKGAVQGTNDFGKIGYGGPCPGSGKHRYFLRLYALDTLLDMQEGGSRRELEKALQDHILAQAELVGLYKRAA